jgi:hypothetical protein
MQHAWILHIIRVQAESLRKTPNSILEIVVVVVGGCALAAPTEILRNLKMGMEICGCIHNFTLKHVWKKTVIGFAYLSSACQKKQEQVPLDPPK